MTITAAALTGAADSLIEAALLGRNWREPLAQFACAADAFGATVVREPPAHARPGLRSEFVLATDSIAVGVADYLKGLAPPDPRFGRVSPQPGQGFVTDLDQFSIDEIHTSAFYEDFLRPREVRWHACAILDTSRDLGGLYLSLKRAVCRDHYSAEEIRTITTVLPRLQSAAAVARAILQAEARGMGRVLGQRGEAVFELDVRGRVSGLSPPARALVGSDIRVVAGRLIAWLPQDDARLQRAIAAPLGDTGDVACVILGTEMPGRRLVVRTVPVVGSARDVFGVTAAFAVVTVWQKPDTPPAALVTALREAFDLTGAEARVAALVGLGVALAQTARTLAIGEGTARNYLKAAMTKAGVSRQAELATLTAMVAPR